ncbi:MAG TPA: hypothetical protein VFC19_48450 [Candidatus Limnocylindrales bacterium]|nr:hypothetical protein [Candidatus Limnocylindrales bacterium]
MRALLLAVLLASGCAAEPKWYEAQPTPSPKALRWNLDVIVGDPLTTTSAEVKDLHRASKRVVCRIGPIQPSDPDAARPGPEALLDRLKLCRDKGFDAVAFIVPTDSLVREAATLQLPVLELPSGGEPASYG